MTQDNALANLKEFGTELKLGDLEFDENLTCILGIDNTFSLHLTYEPRSDRLYIYSPLLDGLPGGEGTVDKVGHEDQVKRAKLYEALLTGAMLGGRMAGGGVGVAVNEGLVLMHSVLEMGLGTDSKSLTRFAPLFVQAVEEWRKIVTDIMDGKEVKVELIPPAAAAGGIGGPGAGGAGPTIGKAGPGGPGNFMKV